MKQYSSFLTVRQWAEQKSWPPLGGIRHLIFHAKSNGFDAVIRRVGRTILLDEAAFTAFVERANAHRGAAGARADPPKAKLSRNREVSLVSRRKVAKAGA